VTVIVPAYRSGQMIADCVETLLDQDTSISYELIVVASGTESEKPVALPADGRLRMIEAKERMTASQARNTGVAVARGSVVAFVDADMLVSRDWLTAILTAGAERCCVAGAVTNAVEGSYWGTVEYLCEFLSLHPRRRSRAVWHGAGGNLALPKQMLIGAGGFAEALPRGQDVALTLFLNRRGLLRFAPEARTAHRCRTQRGEVLRHQRDIGEGAADVAREYGHPWRPLMVVPWLAPVAAATRVPVVLLRAARCRAVSPLRLLVLGPGLVAILYSWGVGLRRRNLAVARRRRAGADERGVRPEAASLE